MNIHPNLPFGYGIFFIAYVLLAYLASTRFG